MQAYLLKVKTKLIHSLYVLPRTLFTIHTIGVKTNLKSHFNSYFNTILQYGFSLLSLKRLHQKYREIVLGL
jgi:hypothetical protein